MKKKSYRHPFVEDGDWEKPLGLQPGPAGSGKGQEESGPRSCACASSLEAALLGGGPIPILSPHPLSRHSGWGCSDPLKGETLLLVLEPG